MKHRNSLHHIIFTAILFFFMFMFTGNASANDGSATGTMPPPAPAPAETPVPAPVQVPQVPNAFVSQTKQWRKDLDEALQRLKQGSDKNFTGLRGPDHPVRSSRERSLAITKLEEAIMWLGMDLKAQDTPNPYPHSKDPTSPIIDPTADGLKM